MTGEELPKVKLFNGRYRFSERTAGSTCLRFETMPAIRLEYRALAALRDALLPELICGKIWEVESYDKERKNRELSFN
jgi:hypothetical protein